MSNQKVTLGTNGFGSSIASLPASQKFLQLIDRDSSVFRSNFEGTTEKYTSYINVRSLKRCLGPNIIISGDESALCLR